MFREGGWPISIIQGAERVFFLRQHEQPKDYGFIGDCYVRGLMEGKVLLDPANDDDGYREIAIT